MSNERDPSLNVSAPLNMASGVDWNEYDSAAEWCAKRGLSGKTGDPLPNLMSAATVNEINEHPEEFAERVRMTAYALAMAKHP